MMVKGRRLSMFERFTDRARLVVVQAQREARTLNHDFIGPEHLLLGLIDGDGVAVRVLDSLGIERQAVRRRVEQIIGRDEHEPPPKLPFTPQAKQVLEVALTEARKLGHGYIGTEHLLLGLIASEGVSGQVLLEQGADLNRARAEVTRILDARRREQGNQTG
jgi:ATP-dependent Clp protease ATP-binding subunit ClpC